MLHGVQVPYHGSSTALVSTHDVRLPKESTVGDLLDALMQQLPAEKRPKQLRLLEIFNGKIYQVPACSLKARCLTDLHLCIHKLVYPVAAARRPCDCA